MSTGLSLQLFTAVSVTQLIKLLAPFALFLHCFLYYVKHETFLLQSAASLNFDSKIKTTDIRATIQRQAFSFKQKAWHLRRNIGLWVCAGEKGLRAWGLRSEVK